MSTRILLGADIVPTTSNYKYFSEGDLEHLIGSELQKLLESADFTVFNLEVPLTDTASPIEKNGPNLIAPTSTIRGLQAINPHFFTLANNHILDQGTGGLYSTIRLLDEAGIAHAGAGRNLSEASRAYETQVGGVNVGVYCCAEHEFSIASSQRAGANPFDLFESFDHVRKLKSRCDYVIVLYHGGKEHYRYPSPQLQKVCRKLVDSGADLVLCQHSHCIGAMEEWRPTLADIDEVSAGRTGTIVYGQGNFLFDNTDSEYWQTGLLVSVDISDRGSCESVRKAKDIRVSYIPLRKHGETVRLAVGADGEKILADFYARSEEIKSAETVARYYKAFADSYLSGYLGSFRGRRSLAYRALNKLSGYRLHEWLMKRRFGKREKLALRNYIECEAHRELVLAGLSDEDC